MRRILRLLSPCPAESRFLLADDFLGVKGNHELLVGGDDQRSHLGIVSRDIGFLTAGVVLLGVNMMPMNSSPSTHLARIEALFSPTPAVKTTASTPPMAAAKEPMYFLT